MLRGQIVYSRCRQICFSSHPEQWVPAIGPLAPISKRYRSSKAGGGSKRSNQAKQQWRISNKDPPNNPRSLMFAIGDSLLSHDGLWKNPIGKNGPKEQEIEHIEPNNVIPYFESQVERWSNSSRVRRRLLSYGIPNSDIRPLLTAFSKAVSSGELSTPEAFDNYALSRFSQDYSEDGFEQSIDAIYSSILFSWAADSENISKLPKSIQPMTISHIEALVRAADYSHPEEEFFLARSMRRKIIMHVGPTNSGKTHNALRALAAAPTGVYAGPLRLLAHEIWERLNRGQIVPLGAEEAPVSTKPPDPDSNTALDLPPNDKAVRQSGNPTHVRECNMLTGEEQKVVNARAGLLSCTVEMLPLTRPIDVAVVDEIQMIGDPDRGSGWTRAVLGIPAKEVHLCGEETAVPLVEELLKLTGDELVVNRYERLTPLSVDKSLDGDLSQIKKGDCVVTFRRENIFALKYKIERQTNMRCAVVYGRLPPETRSEQAALFNEPGTGYDVLIGSDAIGMGLNLKIRRIIFEAVSKFDGNKERFLSISQTKQIAGRAGRYGLHGKDANGGVATTLLSKDNTFLRETMEKTISHLEVARVLPTTGNCVSLAAVLPKNSPTSTIFTAHRYLSIPPPSFRFSLQTRNDQQLCDFMDRYGAGLTLGQRLSYVQAPLPKQSDPTMQIIARLVQMHDRHMDVHFTDATNDTDYITNLEDVEAAMEDDAFLKTLSESLRKLESLHKAIVAYVWLSFRHPLVFNEHEGILLLKNRVEKALDWSLEELTKDSPTNWSDPSREPRRIAKPKIEWVNRRESKLQAQGGARKASRNTLQDLRARVAAGNIN